MQSEFWSGSAESDLTTSMAVLMKRRSEYSTHNHLHQVIKLNNECAH